MPVDSQKLTRKQDMAVGALLVSSTVAAAASASHVHERTLHRWLNQEPFQEAFKAARWQAVSQALAIAQGSMVRAIDCLLKVFDDPQAPVSCKIAAAREVLGLGLKGLEIENIQARLESIESRLMKGERR